MTRISNFKLGGATYLLGAHYSVVKMLLSNPEWLGEKTVSTTNEVKEFKTNATIKGLLHNDLCRG
jgi:hypothetical protein